MRRVFAIAGLGALLSGAFFGQTTAIQPAFEVASAIQDQLGLHVLGFTGLTDRTSGVAPGSQT